MLLEMRVENFILIDKLSIQFHSGLNIFTGETGAGKSMIIGALSAGLGGKCNSDSIRQNADKAFIQLVYEVEFPEAFESLGLELEDNMLIISREIHQNNRSIIRINDRAATLSTLIEVSKLLMDIHGQHAHQTLLYPKNHLNYLDLLGGESHRDLMQLVKQAYTVIKSLQTQISDIESLDLQHLDESYIKFQLDEINSVALTEDDEDHLEKKYAYYKNIEMIYSQIQTTVHLMSGDHDQEGMKSLTNLASRQLSDVSSYDTALEIFSSRMENISFELDDLSSELRHYLDHLDIDEREMYEVESRMNAVSALKVKYGKTIADILFKKDQLQDQLSIINDRDSKIDLLKEDLKQQRKIYVDHAKRLSASRLLLKTAFEKAVEQELNDLNMQDCSFEVNFNWLEKNEYRLALTGLDQVEFMISTNKGMPKGPLSKIASGGEISRIMLAIKLALSNHDFINSLVFDEVDTGISGNTAIVVSEKIYTITQNYQVICITHLPQIAAMSDRHFILNKVTHKNSTTTEVVEINNEEKHKELARMLSGYDHSQLSIDAAIELLTLANKFKRIS